MHSTTIECGELLVHGFKVLMFIQMVLSHAGFSSSDVLLDDNHELLEQSSEGDCKLFRRIPIGVIPLLTPGQGHSFLFQSRAGADDGN